jgi:esterase/lipase superfamily enzyme
LNKNVSGSILSVRSADVGGTVVAARAEPRNVFLSRDELTLFVHGFAVTQAQADKIYRAFGERLDGHSDQAVHIYWPGDLGMPGVTQLGYPLQRRRALDSATELADYIARELDERRDAASRRGRVLRPLTLRVVAHSMGCLLALELLKLLNRPREIEISLIVLMAAAVAQYRLADRDLGRVLTRARQVRVYRSFSDWVLAVAFPIGELPHRPFPEGWKRRSAIGRNGCGDGFANLDEHERSHGHSDYWKDASIAEDVRAASVLAAERKSLGSQVGRALVGRAIAPRKLGESL